MGSNDEDDIIKRWTALLEKLEKRAEIGVKEVENDGLKEKSIWRVWERVGKR